MIAFKDDSHPKAKNVLGGSLQPCCFAPMTGFYRTGYCETGPEDTGRHTVCIEATQDFLNFSKAVGNDLSTPIPQYDFPGLQPGDRWCLCALRWKEAYENSMAPKVYLEATHASVLKHISLDILQEHAVDLSA